MFVRYVVGQLEFVEGDCLVHPLLPGGGTVGVDVHPLGHLGVRLPGNHPVAVVELVSVVVGRNHVEQEDVLGLRVQTRQLKLHLGKHLPEKKYVMSTNICRCRFMDA